MNPFVEAIYKGFALGMTLCFSFGPSFFALLKTSLDKGYRPGLALAIGIFVSDVFCVGLALVGASTVLGSPQSKLIIGIVGGTILAVYGFYSIFQKKTVNPDDEQIVIKSVNIPVTMIKGFALNILNPFVLLLWFGWVAFVSGKENFTTIHVTIFFVVSLITILGTDILKALIAHKIKKVMTPGFFNFVNKIMGLVMVILGVVMIAKTL